MKINSKSCHYQFWISSLLVISVIWTGEVMAATARVLIRCQPEEDRLVLDIGIPASLLESAQHNEEQSEVLISLKSSFVIDNPEILSHCGPLLHSMNTGVNTLLVSGSEGTKLAAKSLKESYQIEIGGTVKEDRYLKVERALQKARLLYLESRASDSVDALSSASKEYPNEPSLLSSLGAYQLASGDRRAAARSLEAWQKLKPDHQDRNSDLQQVRKDYATTLKTGYETISAGDDLRQRRTMLGASFALSDQLPSDTITAKIEQTSSLFRDLRRVDGVLVDLNPTSERFALAWSHPLESDLVELAFAGSDYTFGGHAAYEFRQLSYATTVRAQLFEPDWDYASTVAFDGYKSALSIEHDNQLTKRLRWHAAAGESWFSIEGNQNLAKDFSLTSILDYTFWQGIFDAQIAYTFDADYFYSLDSVQNYAGRDFRIFSTRSTEYHVFTVGASKPISSGESALMPLTVYGFGGYAYNRLGSSSPQGALGIKGGWITGPEFVLEFGRSFSTVQGSQTQSRISAGLDWRL